MKLSIWMTVIAATTGLALAQDVRNNFDAQADFSKFKTYKWVENKASEKPDDLTARQIVETLDAELAKKGLTKTDGDNADLFIGYQTAISTEKEVNSFDTGYGYGPGWRYGGGMGGMSTSTTSTLYIGALGTRITIQAKSNWFGEGSLQKLST